jgi:hypothetical protein
MDLSIEEALRTIREKAAVMRFLIDAGSHANFAPPDSAVLSGLGAMYAEIEERPSRVKGAPKASVLDMPLPGPRQR